jgi:rubrerythrin
MRIMKIQVNVLPTICAVATLFTFAVSCQSAAKSNADSTKAVVTKSEMDTKMSDADTSMKGMDKKNMNMTSGTAAKDAETGYWTCPMHPEVHKTVAGQCPICGMNLVFKKDVKDTTPMKGMDNSKMKM